MVLLSNTIFIYLQIRKNLRTYKKVSSSQPTSVDNGIHVKREYKIGEYLKVSILNILKLKVSEYFTRIPQGDIVSPLVFVMLFISVLK